MSDTSSQQSCERRVIPLHSRPRPSYADPISNGLTAARAVGSDLLDLMHRDGFEDVEIATRMGGGPITPDVVALWRSGEQPVSLPLYLGLLVIAGPRGVDLLYGLPFGA